MDQGMRIAAWVRRMCARMRIADCRSHRSVACAHTGTAWYQTLADYHMCFIRGRLKFNNSGE